MKTRVFAVWRRLCCGLFKTVRCLNNTVLWQTLAAWFPRLGRHDVTMYAAALAYYTLFSSIPLLLFLISTGSYVIDPTYVQEVALQAFTLLLPEAISAVRVNLESLLRYRGVLSTLSALGTLWSASGMFTALERAINAVWEQPRVRAYWMRRLIGMLALIAMTSWVVVAGWVRSIWGVLQVTLPVLRDAERLSAPWRTQALLWAGVTLLAVIIYRFFPAKPVRWRTVLSVSMVLGLAWSLSREVFSWALYVGLLRYPIIYGSLWILLVPVLWAYWSYYMLLIGAEIVAFVEERMPVTARRERIRAR